jgi:hypothetical protein
MGFLGKLGGICPISPTRNARLRAKKESDIVENYFIVVGDVPRKDRQQVRDELRRLMGEEYIITVHHLGIERFTHFGIPAKESMIRRQRLIDLYEQVCTFDHRRVQDMIKAQLIPRHDFQSYKKTGSSPEIAKLDANIEKAFTSMIDGLDVFNIVAVAFQIGFDLSDVFNFAYSNSSRIQDSVSPAYIFRYKL